jgi:DNA polymerase theta
MQVGRSLLDEQLRPVRELQPLPAWQGRDPDHLALLCSETVQEGHSVLVFCASKAWCERAAKAVAALLTVPERTTKFGAAMSPGTGCREWVAQELRRVSGGRETPLVKLVAAGVAYHHGGLNKEERELIETAYKWVHAWGPGLLRAL